MNRLAPSMLNGLAWSAALVWSALALAACGESSCPGGSISVNGRCEPVESCRSGEVMMDGLCVADPMGVRGDAGDTDADVEPGSMLDDGGVDGEVPMSGADAEVPSMPDPLCEGFECGDHGACEVVEGAPSCACDDGFEGELCDSCEAGLVLQDDACVSPCEADSAPDCGDNGACDDSDGEAVCVCEHPAAGDACEECAEGFALQSDGTCKPDCGVCGVHSVCNETLYTPACECVAGYADAGSGCAWVGDGVTGGIADSDLDDPSAWTTERVTIAGGVATFDNVSVGGVCKLGAIEQTIHMPSRSVSEQLVLEIEARTTCTYAEPEGCPPLLVDIGDSLTRLVMGGGASPVTSTLTTCLGDAAYQDEVLVRVRPGLASYRGGTALACGASWPTLQRIGIRTATAGECPARGTLLGSLSSASGWTFEGDASVSGNKLTVGSNSTTATTTVAVPSTGGLAVKFTTTQPINSVVRLDGLFLQMGRPSANATVCLPEWSFGSVHRIGFTGLLGGYDLTNLTVTTDPSCTSGAFDAGFEQPVSTSGWSQIGTDATFASYSHNGARAWRLSSGTGSQLAGLLVMPGYGDSSAHPAISVWTRLAGNNMTGNLRFASPTGTTYMVNASATGGTDIVCFGEEWAGQPMFVTVSGSAALTSGSGTATLWVDDMGPEAVDADLCE